MTVQQQALKIELGEVFNDFWARTESYVKGLIGKPWWQSTKQLLQNEGPLGRMVEHCLIYVVEEGERIAGYKAYTAYLASEYGTSQKHNTAESYRVSMDMAVRTIGKPLLRDLADSEPELRRFDDWISPEEKDFMETVGNVKAREAAAMLDMSLDEVWTKYRLIRRKANRRTP